MIMPLPKASCAWAMLPFSPGTTRCRSKPNASQSQSIAFAAARSSAGASTSAIATFMPDFANLRAIANPMPLAPPVTNVAQPITSYIATPVGRIPVPA